MAVTPQWKRAHERFEADITKVAKKNKLPFRTMTDLVNTNARYAPLIPVLIDWLKNIETKSGLTDPAELHSFRSGIYRSLTTIDAIGTEAVPILFSSFYLEPRASPAVLAAIGNALKYVAMPSDYGRMREIATDRTLGVGRSPVIEWIIKIDADDALPVVMGELDDATVTAYILRALRSIKRLPASLRPAIEPYLDDPDDEVRLQAKRTLAKIERSTSK